MISIVDIETGQQEPSVTTDDIQRFPIFSK